LEQPWCWYPSASAREGNEHVTPLIDRLRDRGWRLTAQRRVIAEVMTGEHVHMAADEVFEAARSVLPEVSLATVYNTLNELVTLGELVELTHADGRKRYDPNVAERHHHLVCVDCGRMLDVAADDPRLPEEQAHGFEVLAVEVTFRARCPDCVPPAG
jgi:Fur family transcriptional regulator, stress-responsive regulator